MHTHTCTRASLISGTPRPTGCLGEGLCGDWGGHSGDAHPGLCRSCCHLPAVCMTVHPSALLERVCVCVCVCVYMCVRCAAVSGTLLVLSRDRPSSLSQAPLGVSVSVSVSPWESQGSTSLSASLPKHLCVWVSPFLVSVSLCPCVSLHIFSSPPSTGAPWAGV